MRKEALDIVLIDDMCDKVAQTLKEQLDGIYISEKNLTSYFIKNLENQSFLKRDSNLIFIDATYENKDLGVSAIDVAEKIGQINSDANMYVLLGADVNRYMQQMASGGDYDAKVFLSRVRALPHVIYGEHKNKLDTISSLIFSHAKKTGYRVEKRLPQGEVSEDVFIKSKEALELLKNLKKSAKLFSEIPLTLPNPQTEDERVMVNLLKDSNDICMQFSHNLSNILLVLSYRVKMAGNQSSSEDKQSNTTNEKTK